MNIQPIVPNDPLMTAFIDLPWQIYPPTHAWVPPLKATVQADLSPDNLFLRHGELQAFVCLEENQVLGRIVAMVDHLWPEPDVGLWGYFECYPNQAMATALLEAAEVWLQQRGKTRFVGPIQLNIYNSYRLQLSGFDTPPFLGEPRCPSYYPELLQQAGYEVCARWFSWDIPGPVLPGMQVYMAEQIRQWQAQNTARYTIETINLADFVAEMTALHPVAMQTFAENFGFTPIDVAEFIYVYQGMVPIMQHHPELFGRIIENSSGQTVGFGMGYMDYAPAFQQINGEMSQWGLLATFVPDVMVFHTFGILPEHRKTTVAYQIFHGGLHYSQQRHCKRVVGALAKEGRTAYHMLGEPSRSYGVLTKAIIGYCE